MWRKAKSPDGSLEVCGSGGQRSWRRLKAGRSRGESGSGEVADSCRWTEVDCSAEVQTNGTFLVSQRGYEAPVPTTYKAET